MDFIERLDRHNKFFWLLVSLSLIAVIGLVDYLTGPQMAFSLFYLLPISLLTWVAGGVYGFILSVASAIVWFIADLAAGGTYSNPLILYWNTAIRLSFFIIVTWLLSLQKRTLEHVKELAQEDSLTGAANTRRFSELVNEEIQRTRRYQHPFSVAYLDLDNFKAVNDGFGHSVGDQVLTTIVKQARQELRKVDTVGRLGGDEFAILMPETDQAAAMEAITRLQGRVLDEMQRHNWPVTFSTGVLICHIAPESSDELIKCADDLMYAVKNSSKNSIRFAAYEKMCDNSESDS